MPPPAGRKDSWRGAAAGPARRTNHPNPFYADHPWLPFHRYPVRRSIYNQRGGLNLDEVSRLRGSLLHDIPHEQSHYRNAPHIHARTSHLSVGAGKDILVQECKETLAKILLRIQILNPNQNCGQIVSALVVQFDILNANFTALKSRIESFSHALPREDFPDSPDFTSKRHFYIFFKI